MIRIDCLKYQTEKNIWIHSDELMKFNKRGEYFISTSAIHDEFLFSEEKCLYITRGISTSGEERKKCGEKP